MDINPNISIYSQIAEMLRTDIISGRLIPGTKVESIRDLAVRLSVNPNTIKRVYQELQEESLFHSEGTGGTFVTNDKDFIARKRREFAEMKANQFRTTMQRLNLTPEDIRALIMGEDER
ncbi:MAG TPA: GntR family transcriptional regulator [Acholeplasmatales bacterium]|nr:MAG: hypothetical protein A2Y16_06205 [Tenericutes bacterium GWF2_57_13]HAQ56926.1 GntR family transcriptional regulator [Acholeplasmatales bacterium]